MIATEWDVKDIGLDKVWEPRLLGWPLTGVFWTDLLISWAQTQIENGCHIQHCWEILLLWKFWLLASGHQNWLDSIYVLLSLLGVVTSLFPGCISYRQVGNSEQFVSWLKACFREKWGVYYFLRRSKLFHVINRIGPNWSKALKSKPSACGTSNCHLTSDEQRETDHWFLNHSDHDIVCLQFIMKEHLEDSLLLQCHLTKK